jgi:hypothetical protein
MSRRNLGQATPRQQFRQANSFVNKAKINVMHAGNARKSCSRRHASLQRAVINLAKANVLLDMMPSSQARDRLRDRAREVARQQAATVNKRFQDKCLV